MRILLALILSIVVTGNSAAAQDAAASPPRVFRAGAATSNVTPPLGVSINGGFNDRRATHVHDELHARCLVLEDVAGTRVAFAVVDSCALPKNLIDAAKAVVAERTKIPASHVLVSATHTHEAPAAVSVLQSEADADYVRFLAVRIADGIQRAANNLAPAEVGWAVAKEPTQVFNRRWRMTEGKVPADPFGNKTDRVKTNPGVGNPDVTEPAGPIDPDVWVMSVRTPAGAAEGGGRHVAMLANYGLHYVGGEGPGAISADYFGMFADRVQELLGADRQDPPFVAMMSNGTSGDINNVDVRPDPGSDPATKPARVPYAQMRTVADVVARAAAGAVKGIRYQSDVTLSARTATLRLGVRKPSAEELERARGILGRSTGPTQVRPEGVYARETVFLADYPDQVELTLQAIRVGDLAIAAIPCEVFVEIGLDLKARSPAKPLFTVSLANGYNGYLPTPTQHALGGYETWRARSSYLEVGASDKITSTLLELLGSPADEAKP